MTLTRVRIDDRTWDDGGSTRRLEWAELARSLAEHAELAALDGVDEPAELLITMAEEATHVSLRRGDAAVETVALPRELLADLVGEYVDTVRGMSTTREGLGSSRIEALDMAKKVVHDRAARKLERALRPLGADHETCRRFFSLFVALRVDTSRLVGVHGHRPIR